MSQSWGKIGALDLPKILPSSISFNEMWLRKRFIKDISGVNDSKNRLGGTISSCLYSMMQGVQILRVHDVNEVNQSIKVFKSLF